MEWIKLGELINIRKGTRLIETDDNGDKDAIRMIMIEDLRNNKNIKHTIQNDKNVLVDEEDIIIAWDGANAGLIGFNLNGALGSTLARLSLKSKKAYPIYLGLYLYSKFEEIRFNCTGATIPHVNRNHLINMKIPVPPIKIQKQIVEILDQAQSLIDNRKEQIELLDDLIESIFYDMFGDPVRNDKGWETDSIKNNVVSRIGNINKDYKLPISYIDISSIDNHKNKIMEYTNYKTIKDAPSRAKKILQRNDVILSTVRPNLNNIALFKMETRNKAIGSTGFCILRPKSKLNSKFLFYIAKSKSVTDNLMNIAKGASYPAVSDNDIKRIEIGIPPISMQNEFARKAEQIESQKQILEESLALLEDNYNSIMQKAFKGELFNDR